MGLADTARLAVQLDLTGNFTGGLSSAESNLGRFNATAATSGAKAGVLSGAFTTVERAAGRVGGALSHAGGQIKSLITGPLGMLGLAGGLLSIGGAIEGSVSKIEAFGVALEKVQLITGETAKDSGTLILLFEKFGIGADQIGKMAGMAEKNLGKLDQTMTKAGSSVSKLAALDKQYGLSLVDSSGKVVSYSEELRQLAAFYDTNASASTKAFVASTLLGRNFTALAPVLAQGSKGLRDAAAAADALGLGSADTAAKIAHFRDVSRDFGEAINVLQLQIGLALLPQLTKLATTATAFVSEHGSEITSFFRNLADFAGSAAGTIGSVVGSIASAWNSLPPELRSIITTGLVADRTVKFLFGFSPIGSIIGGLEKAIGSAVAGGVAKGAVTAGIGKLFVQPVFVTNPGFGGIGGAAADAGEVAGGAAAGVGAVTVAISALAIPIAIGVANLLKNAAGITDEQQQYLNTHGQFGNRSLGNPSYSGYAGRTVQPTVPFHDSAEGHAADTVASALIQFRADERASLTATEALTSVMRDAPWLSKLEASWRKAGQTMHDKIKEAIAGLTGPHSGAAALFLGANLGSHGFGAGGYKQAEAILAELKKMAQSPAVVKAIHELEAKLPRLRTDAKDLAAAEKIVQDSDPKNKKLDDLNRIMADLRAHGDRTTRAKVSDLIAAVKHQKFTVVLPVNVRMPTIVDYGHNSSGRTVQKIVTRSGNWNIS